MTLPGIETVGQQGADGELALIHGWGIGSGVWQPVLDTLAARFRVHLVSLPGYGATPADTHDFPACARVLTAALPPGTFYCGWSLGALLALQAAALAPARVGALVLVGGTASFTQREGWSDAQPPGLLQGFASAIAEQPAATLQRFAALLNQGDTQARAITRAMNRALQTAPLPDSATLLAGLSWLRDVDLRDIVADIAVPTLLIHGENDPLMPLAAAQRLAGQLPYARLEVFPGAAHAPFANDPERFAKLIGDHCHASASRQTTRS